MTPKVSRDDVLRAFDQFDRAMRYNENWSDWEEKESQKYAIEYEGRRYPPKVILSLASGEPVGTFSGGLQGANKAFLDLGFNVVLLRKPQELRAPQVWWVNQGSTYEASRSGGFIWAPNQDIGGVTPGHWRRLQDVQQNDIFVHYSNTAIRAIGRAKNPATASETPFKGKHYTRHGQRIDVEYFDLGDRAVPLDRVTELFGDFHLEDGPFTKKHSIKQGFLWRFTAEGLQRVKQEVGEPWPTWADVDNIAQPPFDLGIAVQQLSDAISKRGFVFEPWQIAAFVTALRTKPFVILAGVSGTGKSRLPRLVADATGCTAITIPVRPDWTDSSDVLGYVDLQGTFRAGPLLRLAERAAREADRFHFCVVDEMNLARVEHYFAEVLSRIESRDRSPEGRLATEPLFSVPQPAADERLSDVGLPDNLAIIGTVNMDESAHGFSRKVLDRAFTLELSDVDLHRWGELASTQPRIRWPAAAWSTSATRLAQRTTGDDERKVITEVIDVLVEANTILAQAQLQVGYRTRDEIALFVLNAAPVAASFVTHDGTAVEPLDLALLMKILPRVAGGSAAIRQVVLGLIGFASSRKAFKNDQQAEELASSWRAKDRPPAIEGAAFPRTAARLCLMWDRLVTEGFTSFWL